MPAVFQITNEDIEYAEKVLLPPGKTFDYERVNYIKNFDTLDLQAVPGSGKTTALLAKLIIIERYLPLDNGSGVLVLSHTNAAVDEIKEKIQKYCPKLFTYPNFIGTIQNFVDEFLAVPYYAHTYKSRPFRIDNDTYISQFYRTCPVRTRIALESRYRDRLNELLLTTSARANRDFIFDSLNDAEIQTRFGKTTNTYQDLRNTKINLIKEGYLNFNEAYCLAGQYLDSIPHVKSIIRKRFMHVFVDEMQDMDDHQCELLERLFIESGVPAIDCYQRIGDKNQSIFNGDAADKNVWKDREIVIQLNGSYRLTPLIARVVENFALYPIQIQGMRTNHDGSAIDIKPHVIVFDDSTINNVIDTYLQLIKELSSANLLPGIEGRYCAIAWNATWSDEASANSISKIRLIDYYPSFQRRSKNLRKDYESLEDYVIATAGFNDLRTIQDSILRSILKVFRLEDIKSLDDRYYTKTTILKYLAENMSDEYDVLKLNLYIWSLDAAKGQFSDVIAAIKAYLPHLRQLFEVATYKSSSFINRTATGLSLSQTQQIMSDATNTISSDGFKVDVGTVHSVKGQTHTGTLYLETYYYADGRGNKAKSYESQRLAEQFRNEPLLQNAGSRVKQSAKMVYVGLSRPTHLMCFAMHRDRFDPLNYSDDWQVVSISKD